MKLHLTESQFLIALCTGVGALIVIASVCWYLTTTKPKTRTITVHDPLGFDIELWTQSFGSRKKPAVLLIHGAGSLSSFWPEHFCKAIAAQGYFVIRYDQRDSGYSSHFTKAASIADDGPYIFDNLTQDAITILDTYNIKKASVIGHSLGGCLAYHLITTHPERFTSAISISASPGLHPETIEYYHLPNGDKDTIRIMYSNNPIGDFSRDYPAWLRTWTALHGELPIEDDRARAYTQALYRDPKKRPGSARNHFATLLTMPIDMPEKLKTITLPVLIIHGEKDTLLPAEHGQIAHSLIPGSEYKELKRAGHMFFNKQLWDTLTADTIEFLNKNKITTK